MDCNVNSSNILTEDIHTRNNVCLMCVADKKAFRFWILPLCQRRIAKAYKFWLHGCQVNTS